MKESQLQNSTASFMRINRVAKATVALALLLTASVSAFAGDTVDPRSTSLLKAKNGDQRLIEETFARFLADHPEMAARRAQVLPLASIVNETDDEAQLITSLYLLNELVPAELPSQLKTLISIAANRLQALDREVALRDFAELTDDATFILRNKLSGEVWETDPVLSLPTTLKNGRFARGDQWAKGRDGDPAYNCIRKILRTIALKNGELLSLSEYQMAWKDGVVTKYLKDGSKELITPEGTKTAYPNVWEGERTILVVPPPESKTQPKRDGLLVRLRLKRPIPLPPPPPVDRVTATHRVLHESLDRAISAETIRQATHNLRAKAGL